MISSAHLNSRTTAPVYTKFIKSNERPFQLVRDTSQLKRAFVSFGVIIAKRRFNMTYDYDLQTLLNDMVYI